MADAESHLLRSGSDDDPRAKFYALSSADRARFRAAAPMSYEVSARDPRAVEQREMLSACAVRDARARRIASLGGELIRWGAAMRRAMVGPAVVCAAMLACAHPRVTTGASPHPSSPGSAPPSAAVAALPFVDRPSPAADTMTMRAVPPVVTSIAPVATSTVSAGALEGRVVDDSTGLPVVSAQIRIQGARLAALSDATGRFRIAGIPGGTQTVRVERVGYGAREQAAQFSVDSGYATLFALRSTPVVTCVLVVTDGTERLFHVRVRDIRTGAAPPSGAVLTGYSAEGHLLLPQIATADSTGALWFRAARFTRPWVYTLIIRSPGYRDWQRDTVRPRPIGCGDVASVEIDAWLIPK